jgi:hypothetical protein
MARQKEIYDYWQLPVASGWADEVYCDNDGHYYESGEEAWEALCWDDNREPHSLECYPALEGKASTPNLHDIIDEHWSEQYDEDDREALAGDLADAVAALQARLEAGAPTLYTPDMTRRIDLADYSQAVTE